MADSKKAADGGADRNVDQIRDILFGGQMRDYERRFNELNARLEAELARMREAQDKRLAQIDKRVDDQLEKLGKLLRQEIQDRNRSIDDVESRLQPGAAKSRPRSNRTGRNLRPRTNACVLRWRTCTRPRPRAPEKPKPH